MFEQSSQQSSQWFSRGAQVLPAGVYRAELKSVNPGIGKGYGKEKEQRPTLMFTFREEHSGAVINRTLTRSNSEKSNLVALIRSMTGDKAPSPEVVRDPVAFQNFILALVGRVFEVVLEPSADGRYNNLVAAFTTAED